MKKILTQVTLLALAFAIVPSMGWAQSKQEGIRLFKAAHALQRKARSNEDLKKAVRKYEEALKIFEKEGFKKGIGPTANNLGMLYANWGKYAKAVEFYEKSLAIDLELKERRGQGRTLNNLGLVYARWGDYDRAVDLYKKSLAIWRQLKDRRGEGSALNNLGMVYANWGQYDKAVAYYEKSLAIKQALNDRRGEGSTLNNLGNIYTRWGQYDKAVAYYEQSLAIDKEMNHRRGEGQTLNNLGNVFQDWGQYDKAVAYFEKSLAIKRALNDRRGEGGTLNNLGNVYKELGENDKAVAYYEKSLAIKRALNDRRGEGQTLNNLGVVYMNWGKVDEAVNHLSRSMAISRELKNRRGERLTLTNLGVIYAGSGQYDKAVEYDEKALAISRDLKDRGGEGSILMYLGNIHHKWGQYDKAVEFHEKALGLFRDVRLRREEGLTLIYIGTVYAARGEYDRALNNLEEGLAIYREIRVPTGWPMYLIGNLYLDMGDIDRAELVIKADKDSRSLGRLCIAKKDFAKAKEHYGKLFRSAQKNRDADDLFVAYTGLGKAYEGVGDNKNAAEYYRKAVEHTEDLRSSLARTEREKFFDVKIGGFRRTAPYEGLARVLMKTNKPIEALKGSEYTKARVFAEAMSRRAEGQKLDVSAEVLKQDERINGQLAALKKSRQKAFEKQNQLTIKSLEPQIEDLEKKLEAHIEMLRDKYPLFAATKYPRPMPLAESALRENEWVLSYDVTDSGVLIYLTKGKQLLNAWFKPIPRKELDALVRKFREPMEVVPRTASLAEKLKSFDFASGRKLTQILLQDVLAHLPKDTPVIVVPDDSLGVLPFEALVLNDAGKVTAERKIPSVKGAEFFGDRNPISYYQSITALTLARTYGKRKTQGKKLLVMADPVFELRDVRAQKSNPKRKLAGAEADMYKNLMVAVEEGELGTVRFNRLPLTGDLARELSTTYKDDSVVYTGLDATKKRFMGKVAPNLSRYRNIVFATHGYFGKNLPGIMEPVLVLSLVPPGTDGFLRLSEVMGLKMNSDIVALTACQTGLGRRISGEGVMGMGRAFQYAGGKSVLMSLWSVAEVSSVKLVESFFQHLKEGKSKLEALRLARKEIREGGYDHPFFWAPFILVGEVG